MSQPYFKAGLYSHHFVLTHLTPNARGLVDSFARNYIQYGLVKAGRKFIREAVKVFGARTANYIEYRFHINQWSAFTKHLANNGVLAHNYEVVLNEADPGETVDINTLPQWQEHDYQIPIGEYLVSDKPTHIKLLEIQTGKGKALHVDARVKVPGGWVRMGDIQLGDSVIARDGTPTQVTGVFPQGEIECSEVLFHDGRSVRCSNDHLWTIRTRLGEWMEKVVSTADLKELLDGLQPVYINLITSEQGPYLLLPADPYDIGKAIARGNHEYDDKEVMSFFEGSHLQRLNLIQGILDEASELKAFEPTDIKIDYHRGGPVLPEVGGFTFTLPNGKVAYWAQYLARSLGGVCSIHAMDGSFRVVMQYRKPSELFRSKTRQAWTSSLTQPTDELHLKVTSVRALGTQPAVCISVNSQDQEFVTNDFISTHNTFCAMKAAARIGKRMAIIIKPGYIDKWIEDVKKICGIERDDITVVQGSAQVMTLMARAEADQITEKVIIFSNRTLQNLFSLYEERGRLMLEQGYAFYPHELFPKLKVGLRLIDEVHQDFHLNFKLDLYTHVAHSISLSATLKSDDAFMNRMYEMTYPREDRYAGLAYDKYVTAFSWMYSVRRPELLRASEHGSMTYSHHAFEKSLIRQPSVLDSFLDMVHAIVRRFYMADDYVRGDRCLVYCASIDMCTRVMDHLKALIKDKDIRRYVEDDPYENLMDAEICVSTLLSAGTGHDIAQLTTVILTTNVLSHQSNVQGFGRLRKLPNRKLRFVYTNCTDVPKHLEYHEKKRELLRLIALDYNTVTYGQVLG